MEYTQTLNDKMNEDSEYLDIPDSKVKSGELEENTQDQQLEVSIPVKDSAEQVTEAPLIEEISVINDKTEEDNTCNEQDKSNTVDIETTRTNEQLESAVESVAAVAEVLETVEKANVSTGLSMLAQYDSDAADSDKAPEAAAASHANPYRSPVVNLDSETDSDDSSQDSSCIEDVEDKRCFKQLKKTMEKIIADCSDDDDADDENRLQKRKPPKVKGELLLDDLPPIQDLHITVPEDECVELGKVHSIVDQLVLVSVLPKSLLVDLDTVLFLDKGKRVLGEVFDVLGQISEPLYCVRFNSNEQIIEKNISVGDKVYVAPKSEYTQFIILSNLLNVRGSDASWENDIEPPPRYVDYSDDEQERLARTRVRNKDRQPASEHQLQQKRACPQNMKMEDDTDSVASCSTNRTHGSGRPMHNAYRGGRGRGRGRGNALPTNSNYMLPNMESWHSYCYPGPAPPPMFYAQNPMHAVPPYGHHYNNMAPAYLPNSGYTAQSSMPPINTPPPPPPGT